jgi:outer membrane protein OmpA-like peptidoglycan-associated protein
MICTNKTILGAALIVASLFSSTTLAQSGAQDVVVDRNGVPVRSILSGECVRTKWDAQSDVCSNAAPVPAPAAMKEQSRAYLTFFDFDKSVLTPEALEVINGMLAENKADGRRAFQLVGHADRSGSDAYNNALSKKRTESVMQELMNSGVAADSIEMEWKGESVPLVPTADGIKEPQNRRVEIKVFTEVQGR